MHIIFIIHDKMIFTLTREDPSLYNLKYGMKMGASDLSCMAL